MKVQRSSLLLSALFVLIAASIWSNIFWTQKGSVLDHPILDPNNKFVKMEQEVRDAKISLSNRVSFYFSTPKVSKEALLDLIEFCEKSERFFDERNVEVGVAGLPTLIDNQRPDDAIEHFITRKDLSRENFYIDAWYERLANIREVKGKLMGRIDGEYDYFTVVFLPPQDFPETEMYRLVKSFLQGVDLGLLELYIDPETRVDPAFLTADMRIDPMGFVMARGDIDFFSNRETFGWMIPAIVLVSFWILLFKLGSWRQTVVGVAMVTLGMMFTRATIGVIDHLTPWFCPDESFTILVYIVSLIPGFSFALRRFEEWNSAQCFGINRQEVFWQKWEKADQVGIASRLIVFISILDFLFFMVYTNRLGSRSMFQIGIFASFGIFYEWMLAQYFIPSLYKLFGGINDETSKMPLFLQNGSKNLNKLTKKMARFVLRCALGNRSAKLSVVVLTSLVLLTVVLVSYGRLNMESDPGEFLSGMRIGEMKDELNKQGRPGFSSQEVYVSGDINDPAFMEQVLDYYELISQESRTVSGILDSFLSTLESDYPQYSVSEMGIKRVIQEVAKKDSENPEEVIGDIWQSIKDEADHRVLEKFLSEDGMIFAASSAKTSSSGIADFRDMLLNKAVAFDLLEVKTPGRLAQYSDLDRGIVQGATINPFLSQIMIFVICAMWIGWNNRKAKSGYKLDPVKTGIFIAIPFVLATSIMYLFMMAARLPFDIASSAINSIAVSVAIDLPVFFVVAFQRIVLAKADFKNAFESDAMVEEVEKAIVDFAVNTPAFIPLAFSNFPVIYRIGWLMVLVLFACMIGTFFFMAPMMRFAVVKIR